MLFVYHVPESHVPESTCPRVHMPSSPHVLESTRFQVFTFPSPHVSESTRLRVHTSPSPHVSESTRLRVYTSPSTFSHSPQNVSFSFHNKNHRQHDLIWGSRVSQPHLHTGDIFFLLLLVLVPRVSHEYSSPQIISYLPASCKYTCLL